MSLEKDEEVVIFEAYLAGSTNIVYPVLLCANHVNIPKKCVLE